MKNNKKREYEFNKNYGLEKPAETDVSRLSPAAQRWAKMSLDNLIRELDKWGLTYKQAQLMVKNGTLPEEFGLGVV